MEIDNCKDLAERKREARALKKDKILLVPLLCCCAKLEQREESGTLKISLQKCLFQDRHSESWADDHLTSLTHCRNVLWQSPGVVQVFVSEEENESEGFQTENLRWKKNECQCRSSIDQMSLVSVWWCSLGRWVMTDWLSSCCLLNSLLRSWEVLGIIIQHIAV